jgi:hypothetical protein
MDQDQYGMSASISNGRRRQYITSPSRFVKCALFAFFVLLTIVLWNGSELPPTVSRITPGAGADNETQNAWLHSGISTSTSDKVSFPKFGKITATFGEPDPPYENAIASHKLHNEIHGYPHFILREQLLRGLWSKHAYILTIIGNELAKPENERLEWVLWHDRDTVLMNPQIPLDIFVPPPEFSHIHMLVTDDRNGLNNGVFLCRVSAASFKFFASALSIREYQPEIQLKYTEQSGMEEVIKRVCNPRLHVSKYPAANNITGKLEKCRRLRPPALVQRVSTWQKGFSSRKTICITSRVLVDPFCIQPRWPKARTYGSMGGDCEEEIGGVGQTSPRHRVFDRDKRILGAAK